MRDSSLSPSALAALVVATSSVFSACGPECGGGSLNLTITNHTTSFTGMITPYQPQRLTATVGAGRGVPTIDARECSDQTLATTRSMTIHVSACGNAGEPCCGMTCSGNFTCMTPSGGSTPLCLIADPMVVNRLGSRCDPSMGMCPQNTTCTYGFCIASEMTGLVAGHSYAVSTNIGDQATYIVYSEGPQASPTAEWRGRGGWVQIDTIEGNVVTLHLTSVLFEPNPMAMGTAEGTFTFDGTGRVEGVCGLEKQPSIDSRLDTSRSCRVAFGGARFVAQHSVPARSSIRGSGAHDSDERVETTSGQSSAAGRADTRGAKWTSESNRSGRTPEMFMTARHACRTFARAPSRSASSLDRMRTAAED
jgi:hypothetical protein